MEQGLWLTPTPAYYLGGNKLTVATAVQQGQAGRLYYAEAVTVSPQKIQFLQCRDSFSPYFPKKTKLLTNGGSSRRALGFLCTMQILSL